MGTGGWYGFVGQNEKLARLFALGVGRYLTVSSGLRDVCHVLENLQRMSSIYFVSWDRVTPKLDAEMLTPNWSIEATSFHTIVLVL